MGTMVTLRVRLTMQPQHEPIRNFTSILMIIQKRNRMKKRYDDISRLIFSVTACIGIQCHLSKFWKKLREKRIYVILCTGLRLTIAVLAISI